MQYSIVKRANPLHLDQIKFYASPCYGGVVTLDEMAEDLSDATTLNKVDIMAALQGLITRIPKYVLMGYRLKIGDLGTFRLSFRSKGQQKIEKVSSADIKNPRIVFMSGKALKNAVEASKVSFTFSGDAVEYDNTI